MQRDDDDSRRTIGLDALLQNFTQQHFKTVLMLP
jgi:hypothetical protein